MCLAFGGGGGEGVALNFDFITRTPLNSHLNNSDPAHLC